jgi:uncharacterized protein (DUF1697 family)
MTLLALLRGINVGGHAAVPMATLRAWLTELGFEAPRTLLQTGNLVFRGGARRGAELERHLEAEADARLGLRVKFFVRTAVEWRTIVARNPFPAEAEQDPAHLILLCLKQAPDRAAVHAAEAAITGRERLRTDGRQAYIVYPDGIGKSRLTSALLERKLGSSGTARNWNTVLKLDALAND